MALDKKNIYGKVQFEFDKDYDSELFLKVRMKVMHDFENPNQSYFEKESMINAQNSIANKPILGRIMVNKQGDEDFNGHDVNMKIKETEEGLSVEYEYLEKVIGIIPETNNYKVEFDEDACRNYVYVDGYIYKGYSNGADEIFLRDGEKKISMEILVDDGYYDDEKGYYVIKKYRYTGVTALGDHLQTGMLNAKAVVRYEKTNEVYEKMLYQLNKELGNDYNWTEFDEQFEISFEGDLTNFPNKGDNDKISLKNSKFPQADYNYVLTIREEHPEVWKKGGNEFGNTAFTNWGKVRNGEMTDTLEKWIVRRERFMERHEKDKRVAGAMAVFKWGGIVSRGQSYMKKLLNEEKKKYSEEVLDDVEYSIPKDEIGKSDSLEYSTSKEDADFDTPWGDVNKIELRDDIYEASNYETLIDKFYLIKRDGWEQNQTSVAYPVGIKKDDIIVLSATGCQSALGFLERNKDDPQYSSAKSKLKKYYEELELDTSNFENEERRNGMDNFEMDMSIEQIKDAIWEKLNPVDEEGRRQWRAYIVATFPDEGQVIVNYEGDEGVGYVKHNYEVSEKEVILDEGEKVYEAFLTQSEKESLDAQRELADKAEGREEEFAEKEKEFELEKATLISERDEAIENYNSTVETLKSYQEKEKVEKVDSLVSEFEATKAFSEDEIESFRNKSVEISIEELEKEMVYALGVKNREKSKFSKTPEKQEAIKKVKSFESEDDESNGKKESFPYDENLKHLFENENN